MPDQKGLTTQAHSAAIALRVPRVVMLTEDEDGVVTLVTHGFSSHMHVNNVLSVGIHANLSDHDRKVMAGDAGSHAAEVAQGVAEKNGD